MLRIIFALFLPYFSLSFTRINIYAVEKNSKRNLTKLDVFRSNGEQDDFAALLGFEPQGYKDISVVHAYEWTSKPGHDFIYIDIRSQEEYDNLMPPRNTINIPAFVPDRDWQDEECNWTLKESFIKEMEEMFSKDAKLLVGCKANSRSAIACKKLVEKGFTNVWNVESGGFMKTRLMGEDF
mmetsp:Transcript_17322/g.25670  ORF Transcript_17322/g.25670 Transcript_17322/m.25670 type:complete len:181 (-) Transcript_17322:26-568(-)